VHDNQRGDSRKITNKTLFDGDLPEGMTWDLTFFVMEEDGGNPEKVLNSIQNVSKKVGGEDNPLVKVLGVAVGFLMPIAKLFPNIDTDDYIGSFRVTVTRKGGVAVPAWEMLDRGKITHRNVNGLGEDEIEIIMDGDGSQYPGWYRIIQ
jgi:hypothetical protein